MENHMEEVAKLLGLELYEEFTVPVYNQNKYQIRKEGLCVFCDGFWDGRLDCSFLLECLLLGKYEIVKSPWEPKIDEPYYFVNSEGHVVSECNADFMFDKNMIKLGNCYRNAKEAENNIEKWKKFYNSDDVLEIN